MDTRSEYRRALDDVKAFEDILRGIEDKRAMDRRSNPNKNQLDFMSSYVNAKANLSSAKRQLEIAKVDTMVPDQVQREILKTLMKLNNKGR